MQQFAKAEEHFDTAIKLEPYNPVHLVYKGLVSKCLFNVAWFKKCINQEVIISTLFL